MLERGETLADEGEQRWKMKERERGTGRKMVCRGCRWLAGAESQNRAMIGRISGWTTGGGGLGNRIDM